MVIKPNGNVSDWNVFRGNLERSGVTYDSYGIMLGDINSDGLLDVLDVMQTVNIIMGSIDPTSYQEITADMNLDEDIDIFDIILLVNSILN